jgi:nucleotide-binding universal stress UspA family protein
MFKRILFPTDGSRLSAKAARVALRLAKEHRARLTALYVTSPFIPPVMADVYVVYPEMFSEADYRKAALAGARKVLARTAAAAKAAGVRCETATAESAHPWSEILRVARKGKSDLIVMASHGRRGIEGVLLGSETSKVLTHSKVPVLVCR